MKKATYLAYALILLFPILSHAEGGGPYSIAGFDDPSKVEPFVENLKKLVTQDKKEELAQLIRYPLKITASGRRIVLRTPKDFLKHYDQAFNAKVREALSKQDSKNLFANWQGAMIGNGEIWIQPNQEGVIQIKAINN